MKVSCLLLNSRLVICQNVGTNQQTHSVHLRCWRDGMRSLADNMSILMCGRTRYPPLVRMLPLVAEWMAALVLHSGQSDMASRLKQLNL
jgi:hypothetical protein